MHEKFLFVIERIAHWDSWDAEWKVTEACQQDTLKTAC